MIVTTARWWWAVLATCAWAPRHCADVALPSLRQSRAQQLSSSTAVAQGSKSNDPWNGHGDSHRRLACHWSPVAKKTVCARTDATLTPRAPQQRSSPLRSQPQRTPATHGPAAPAPARGVRSPPGGSAAGGSRGTDDFPADLLNPLPERRGRLWRPSSSSFSASSPSSSSSSPSSSSQPLSSLGSRALDGGCFGAWDDPLGVAAHYFRVPKTGSTSAMEVGLDGCLVDRYLEARLLSMLIQ